MPQGTIGESAARIGGTGRQVGHLPKALRIVWSAAGGWNVGWLCLVVIAGLIPAATITLMKLLIDQMVRSAGGSMSAEALRPLLFLGGAMAAIGILHEGLQGLLEWVRA